jgi:hypothetical protein
MRFFVCAFVLLFLQCQDGNDVEQYKQYLKDADLFKKQNEIFHQVHARNECDIYEMKYHPYKSLRFERFYPIYTELKIRRGIVEYNMFDLQRFLDKESRLSYNSKKEPTFFSNDISNEQKEYFLSKIDSIVLEINTKYINALMIYKDSLDNYPKENYTLYSNRIFKNNQIKSSQFYEKAKINDIISCQKLFNSIYLANSTIHNQYETYIMSYLTSIQWPKYNIQHFVIIEENIVLPNSPNRIIVKTDNFNVKVKSLIINGVIQSSFNDLDAFYYKFKTPSKIGTYKHKVELYENTPDGEYKTRTFELTYKVVDTIC